MYFALEGFGISATLLCLMCLPGISISFVSHSGPMIVGKQYELLCFIQNVDPSKIVAVRWYKRSQNNATDTIKTPVSITYKLQISPHKTDDGAQYWCEAELEAGGPQHHMSSEQLNITVHCMFNNLSRFTLQAFQWSSFLSSETSLLFPVDKPIINETKLPSTVPVFRGYPDVLVCEAEGNPKPTISWILGTNLTINSENLTISESTPENVLCTASNSVGRTTIQVNVVLKGNYAFLHMFWFTFPTAFFGGGSTLLQLTCTFTLKYGDVSKLSF